MRVRDIFKVSRKTFFNPSSWIDYEGLKEQNRTIKDILKALFTTPKPENQETFEGAMQRMGLSEADIQLTIKQYSLYALLFFILGTGAFIYSFYLLFRYGTFIGWLLGISVMALFFAQAFRYDFWAFQMKSRKLGMTFGEWKNHILGIKGPIS